LKKLAIRLFCCLFIVFTQPAFSQEPKHPALLPDHLKLQFAGNIGFLSIGAGYVNKSGRLEGDFFYGYVPESIGGVDIHTITSKLSWHLIKGLGSGRTELKPLSLGILVSYTFGKQYFGFKPENYPYNYYRQPTSLHVGSFIGGQINRMQKKGRFSSFGLYYELTTMDTEVLSYVSNRKSIGLGEIVSLGIGIKAGIR